MSDSLLSELKSNFGYSSFRPLQREIIEASLAGSDVLAVLPTGGGKSLCFQLPALIRGGLTVVVSPLIALMKDQVDALEEAGVPATFLNSTLDSDEARTRFAGLYQGRYHLLYVAPERLIMDDFLSYLPKWNVTAFAVDEAHCISEWGHDFRPEYRALSKVREVLPEIPCMALTATATDRVRGDIVRQLGLKDAQAFVGSFNRHNLFYRVLPKVDARRELLSFIKERSDESGIVYCQSRKQAESLAEFLKDNGITSRPYHAGLDHRTRERNQDSFINDRTQVICATIAFGMGIDKPDVRFVVHYDLPKNVEGYYQETGRAGRDGLPAQCVLFFSAGDVAKYAAFIDEKEDEQEQRIARHQLSQMVHFAESHRCRRVELLGYFGEPFTEGACDTCDNCLTPRKTVDGTAEAQKLLSCILRVYKHSGFSVGLGHLVEVLTGGNSEKIQKWGHEALSTWGIGKDHSRKQWMAIGRELTAQGLVRQCVDRFNVLEVTEQGYAFLKQGGEVQLSDFLVSREEAVIKAKAKRATGDFDAGLFERLRGLRRSIAAERKLPPYMIFSDAALQDMARRKPRSDDEFLEVNGVGAKKLEAYGKIFLKAIENHLEQSSVAV